MSTTILLAGHCGPVLAKKKPAALFPLKVNSKDFKFIQNDLEAAGVNIEILNFTNQKMLLLVYNPQLLKTVLENIVVKRTLYKIGYTQTDDLQKIFSFLRQRIQSSKDFPHEIGFFLGYPPSDVVGFIHYKGRCHKYCCMWKVYTSVERAKNLCEEFEYCRMKCRQFVENGGEIQNFPSFINSAS